MRPAFTLVELLVAIVVLTVGVLALAATAGLVASHVGDGARLTAAAHAARSVLDSLGAETCPNLVSAGASRDGVALHWTVERDSLASRITLSAASSLRRRARLDRYQEVVPCATN